MTIDGKITTRDYSPVDFTSRADKTHLLQMRALGDAVLIGRSTLEHDNPRMSVPSAEMRAERRARGQTPYPTRVIVSNGGRIDPALNVFQTDISPILIFSTTKMPVASQTALREKATLHLSDDDKVDLAWMVQQLRADYGIRQIACEGGAELFRGLLELGLVDQLNVTFAPYVFGGNEAPTLTGRSREFLPRSVACRLADLEVKGDECFAFYRVKHASTRRL